MEKSDFAEGILMNPVALSLAWGAAMIRIGAVWGLLPAYLLGNR